MNPTTGVLLLTNRAELLAGDNRILHSYRKLKTRMTISASSVIREKFKLGLALNIIISPGNCFALTFNIWNQFKDLIQLSLICLKNIYQEICLLFKLSSLKGKNNGVK